MVSKALSKPKESTDNHELILDSAGELLQEFGYKRMTIDELAKHAGLGKGTVYLYFESKQEVALSFIDRQNRRLQEYLRSILRTKAPAKNRLREILIQRVMYRFQCVQNHKQGIDDLLLDLRPQLFERRAKYLTEETRILAELLIEGRTTGELAFEEPFKVAEAFLDATNSLLPHSLSPKQLGEKGPLLERTAFLVDLMVRSVDAHPVTETNSEVSAKNTSKVTRSRIESERNS